MLLSSTYLCMAFRGSLPFAQGSLQSSSTSDPFRSQLLGPSYVQTNGLVGSGQSWLLSYLAPPTLLYVGREHLYLLPIVSQARTQEEGGVAHWCHT